MIAKTTIKRIGSLFFLGIFLWFYAVKDLHDIYHSGDEHCHVQNAKHFHTQEHHCPICEFEFPSFNDKGPKVEVTSHNFFIRVQILNMVQVINGQPVSLSSPRAPPLVA